MKTSFVIVLFNTPEPELVRLRDEIENIGLSDYSIIFIDNTQNNIGFAGAVNKGIRKAIKNGADLLVICNPDISFHGLKAEKLLMGKDYFDIWGLAMNQGGKYFYGGEINEKRMSGGLIEDRPKKRFCEVDFISGSLMFIKTSVIEKVGYFNEKYFLYYEDVDYCYKAKREGLKVGIDSESIYKHFEASNSRTLNKDYFLAKNRFIFFWNNSSLYKKAFEFARLPKTVLEYSSLMSKLFLNSKFLTNFFALNITSFLTKVLHFVLFIFLVRFFTPSDYGIYTLVWAYIGLFTPVLDFGTTSYGLLYSHKDKDKSYSALFSLRLVLSLIVMFTSVLLAFLSLDHRLAIFVFFTSSVFLSNAWSGSYLIVNSLQNSIFKSSLISLFFNLVLTAVLIALTVNSIDISNIFKAIFISYLLYGLFNLYLLRKAIKKIKHDYKISSWLSILKKSYIFVLIGFFAGIYFKLDVFLLNRLKSNAEVGIYSSGYKFFEALLFIPGSYNLTSAPNLAKLSGNIGLLKSKVKKHSIFLLILGFGIALFFHIISPYLLNLFLKGGYNQGIKVAQVVMFALPFMLLSSIYLNVLYVFERQWVVVYIFIFQIAINFILNYFLIPKFSYMACAYTTVFAEIINFALAFLFSRNI